MQKRYYRARELARYLGIGRSTVWDWARTGRLPKPIELAPGVRLWDVREVEEWLQSKREAA